MSSVIGDLQNTLNQSWGDPDDDAAQQEVVDISTLAMNLSSQTEYNNELLAYIRDLERALQNSETYRHELAEKYGALEENFNETSDRADDLYHKLQISSSLCDELSSQLKALRNDSQVSHDGADRDRETIESLMQQNQYLEKSNKQFSEQIHRLESEVDAAQRFKKSILSDETTETVATLTYSLESTQAELERTRKEFLDMQLISSEVKDENIQLMHRIEHLTKQRDDDSTSRDNSMVKMREATIAVSDLQQQVAELSTKNDHLQEALSAAEGRLQHSHSAHDHAVEHSLQTDLRWRELEELCKQLQVEKAEAESICESLEEKNQLLAERIKSLQLKDREWEMAVREDCDRTVEGYKLKMEDMARQLDHVKDKFDMENDTHEDSLKTATTQIEKLNTLLFKCREDLTAKATENKTLREEGEAKCAQLETIVSEMREEKRIALTEEREVISEKKREIQRLKDQLITRGERYSTTIGAMHDAIHAIGSEASFLKNQFMYISAQQERLLVLMRELKQSQAVPETLQDLDSNGEIRKTFSHRSALQSYGIEIQKTISVLVGKVVEARDELEAANYKINEQKNEIQTLKHICEEQDGKLVVASEKVSFSKGTISRLEKQCEEAVQSNKDLMATMQSERDRNASRLDKAEERVSDMIKQNTKSQTELVRVQSLLEASHKESDSRYSTLLKKFNKLVEERDFYVEASKNSDTKYSAMQDKLMQSEAKIAKQQSDFQKLKKISISMRDDIKKLTTQRSEQVSALNRALDQCRIQLEAKQQVIATLQAQRTEMMSSSSTGKSPFTDVPMAASYSSTVGGRTRQDFSHLPRSFAGGSRVGGLDIFSGGVGRGGHTGLAHSSSNSKSSSNALSGLARLIHSHGSPRDMVNASGYSTSRDDLFVRDGGGSSGGQFTEDRSSMSRSQRGMMSRVKAPKGDVDIGDSVFHSSLKHLSATVSQMEADDGSLSFRAPALQPSPGDYYSAESKHYASSASAPERGTNRSHHGREQLSRNDDFVDPLRDTSDIFHLTSPTKLGNNRTEDEDGASDRSDDMLRESCFDE